MGGGGVIICGKNGLLLLFFKNLAQCPCFETSKHYVPILKLDLKKIEIQAKLDISNVEFYAYFATIFWKFVSQKNIFWKFKWNLTLLMSSFT